MADLIFKSQMPLQMCGARIRAHTQNCPNLARAIEGEPDRGEAAQLGGVGFLVTAPIAARSKTAWTRARGSASFLIAQFSESLPVQLFWIAPEVSASAFVCVYRNMRILPFERFFCTPKYPALGEK